MLSDRSIRRELEAGRLGVTTPDGPLSTKSIQIQPVSIDLRLGAVSLRNGMPLLEKWIIWPQQFLLGSTYETVSLCENLVATVEGKSTIAREGLIVEAAGLVDPGFHGELTLELFNMSDRAIRLDRLQLICQLALHRVDTTPELTYGQANNHYQGQVGPTPSWRLRKERAS